MENEKKFRPKNIVIIIAAIAVIAVIVLAFIFYSGEKITFNDTENISEAFALASPREDKPILYIKNGALYTKPSDGSGDAVELSANLCSGDVIESSSIYANLVRQSKNSDVTYFVKDFSTSEYIGTLCATTDYKTVFEIDSSVAYDSSNSTTDGKIAISDDGKVVVYMKNLVKTEDELYADLYYKNIDDKDAINVANELYGFSAQYIVSPDGSYIAAYSDYNDEKKVGGLYILKNGEEAKALVLENTSNVLLKSITNDGKLIYAATAKDAVGNKLSESVYVINHEDMSSKTFGSNVDIQNVYVSNKSDKFVYLDYTKESILAYAASYNTEPVLITNKYYGFTSIDIDNDCYVFAAASGDETYAAKKKVYVKTPELSEAVLLCDNISIPSDVKQSVDYKVFYYLSDSSLYTVSLADKKLSEPLKIAENIQEYKLSQGGNSIVFKANSDEESGTCDLKAYTKESGKVSDIVSGLKLEHYNLSVDGLSVVYAVSLKTGQVDGFTANLKQYNLYGKNQTFDINNKASMMFYYYDQYLASTTDQSITPRNSYHVRSGNSVLYYTDVGTDCASGNLVLFRDGKETVIDTDVITLLFE